MPQKSQIHFSVHGAEGKEYGTLHQIVRKLLNWFKSRI
jgi:hypothetical protein